MRASVYEEHPERSCPLLASQDFELVLNREQMLITHPRYKVRFNSALVVTTSCTLTNHRVDDCDLDNTACSRRRSLLWVSIKWEESLTCRGTQLSQLSRACFLTFRLARVELKASSVRVSTDVARPVRFICNENAQCQGHWSCLHITKMDRTYD